MQGRNKKSRQKLATRSLTPFEEAILEHLHVDFTTTHEEVIRKNAALLRARAKSSQEKSHPVYLTMLYASSACLSVLGDKMTTIALNDSKQYFDQALQFMEQNKTVIVKNADSDWRRYQAKVMQQFKNYFILLFTHFADEFRTNNIGMVMAVICSIYQDKKLAHPLSLPVEVREYAIRFFLLSKKVIMNAKIQHKALKKFSNYYMDDYFEHTQIFCLLFEIIEASVWKVLKEDLKLVQDVDPSEFEDSELRVIRSIRECVTYLASIKQASLPMMIPNFPSLITFANRLTCTSDQTFFDALSIVLEGVLIRSWYKSSNNILDLLWYQQFYFETISRTIVSNHFASVWEWNSQKISEYLQGKEFITQHLIMHLVNVWYGLSSISSLIMNKHLIHTDFKICKRDASLDARSIELLRVLREQLSKPHFIPAGSYSFSFRRRLVEEVNSILNGILKSIDILKHVTEDHQGVLILDVIPLPCMNNIMPGLFSWLPTIEQFQESSKTLTMQQTHLASKQYQDDMRLLEKCYSQLKDIILYLSRQPLWFMEGGQTVAGFKAFAQKILDPRLQAITEQQREDNRKLLEYANNYQNAVNLSIQMASRFVEEEAVKSRLRKEARKMRKHSKNQAVSKPYETIIRHDTISEEHFKVNDTVAPYIQEHNHHEKTDDIYDEAMHAFSRRHYYKARERFVALGQFQGDCERRAREGVYVCQIEIVIRKLMHLRRNLEAMAASRKVSLEQTKSCNQEVQRLQKEYQSLISQYSNLSKILKGASDPVNLAFLEDRKNNLDRAWQELESIKDEVMIQLNYSRYDKIMSLGFTIKQIDNQQKRLELFNQGVNQCVYEKDNKQKKLNSEFQTVYDAGLREFQALGLRNQQEHGASPYTSMREMLAHLDYIIYSARQMQEMEDHPAVSSEPLSSSSLSISSTLSASSVDLSEAPPTSTAATTTVTSTNACSAISRDLSANMTEKSMLEYLCESQLTDAVEKEALSVWMKTNPKSLATLMQSDGSYASLAFECVNAWFLTNELKERIIFLDETGILRWLLSLSGAGPLISNTAKREVNCRFDKIAESIGRISEEEWQPDLILAQIIATIVFPVVDQKWLIDNLSHFGLMDRSLRKMCNALNLSPQSQSALHAYLVTHVRKNQPQKPYPNNTIQALDEGVQQYNQKLILSGDIQHAPASVLIYGSHGYRHLLEADYIPADIDVRTNLPMSVWPFKVALHHYLSDHQVYQRVLENDQREQNVSIKYDLVAIMDAIQTVDFTISQAMYHVGLRATVYWTEAAFESLMRYKTLCFVRPISTLCDDPKLLLRILIAGNNTKFYLSEQDALKLNALVAIECDEARQVQKIFLKPSVEPGCLLHFLFHYCVYRSAEQYLTLAMHYGILPILLPIPFDACSLSSTAYVNFKNHMQQFDLERVSSPNLDGWLLLGKLIASVFVTFICPLQNGFAIMTEALQALTQFLPEKPRLFSAVKHYLSLLDHKNTISLLTAISSIVSMGPASSSDSEKFIPLQEPILPSQMF